MLAIVASLKVKPDQRTRFLAAVEDGAACSVRDEAGCLRFDVLQDNADANHFFVYEVYQDDAALQAHGHAPHYSRWRAAAAGLLAEPAQRTITSVLFPREHT
jgi:autoinducer 2-degrading protein